MNKSLKIAVTLALASAAFAHAQIRPVYQYPAAPKGDGGPVGVQLLDTPLYATPNVGLVAGYDDNLFITKENKKKSAVYMVSPGFKMDARTAQTVLQLAYQVQAAQYAQRDRKSTRLNSSHIQKSRMPSSA